MKTPTEHEQNLIEVARLSPRFAAAKAKAEKLAQKVADSFGGSRVRMTTLRANWATAAEERERLRKRLIELGAASFAQA
jgi:uncharacterized protein (DUF305 family)